MALIKRRKESDLDSLREGLQINRNDLDEDIIRQPQLFLEVSEKHAMARSRADQAKEELARVDAELYAEYKGEPVTTEEEKKARGPTEAAVKAKVTQDKSHIRAQQDFLDAGKESAMLWALKEAYDQRGRMLHELVALYVAGYFSRSSAKGGIEGKAEANRRTWQAERNSKLRS